MRQMAAVMRRELWELRSFIVAALVAAAAVVVVPWIAPLITRWAVAEIREVLANFMAVAFAWLAALFLGAGMVGKDLAEGRLGFYLSRPLRLASVWFGKLAAVVVVVLGCELLILLPAILWAGTEPYWQVFVGTDPIVIGIFVGIPIVLILIAHAVGIMWRCRSTWLLLDAAGLFATGLACWLAMESLWRADAQGAAMVLGIGVFLCASVCLLVAGAAGLVVGRAEPRRHHGALSITLWSLMLVVSLSANGFSWWVQSAGLEDLESIEMVLGAPSGDGFVVEGEARGRFGYQPRFLVDGRSGGVWRINAAPWLPVAPLAFAGNGKRLVTIEPVGDGLLQVVVHDLDGQRPDPLRTNLFVEGPQGLALSKDGDRVAIIEEWTLSVYDLPFGELRATARIPEKGRVLGPLFVGPELVRIHVGRASSSGRAEAPGDLRIFELDTAAGSLRELGKIPEAGDALEIQWHRASGRALLWRASKDDWRWAVLEGSDATVVRRFGRRELGSQARMLADGRVVHGRSKDGLVWIEVLGLTGGESTTHELGAGGGLIFGGEVAAGRLVVAIRSVEAPVYWWTARSSLVVDLQRGTVRPIGDDLFPAVRWQFLHNARPIPDPGGFSSRLLRNRQDRLVTWDPATGELTELVKGRD